MNLQDQMANKLLNSQPKVVSLRATSELLKPEKVVLTAAMMPRNPKIMITRMEILSLTKTSLKVEMKILGIDLKKLQVSKLMSKAYQFCLLEMLRKMLKSKSSKRLSTKKKAMANGASKVLTSSRWFFSFSKVCSEVARAKSASRDAAQPTGCSSLFSSW